MKNPQSTIHNPQSEFGEEVIRESGEPIHRCYQCRKCAAGCPVIQEMDCPPNAVLRLVQLGLKEDALGCSTIWLCAGCLTCTTRCPNDIDIARVMDVLRERAIWEGVRPAEREIAAFHSSFLASVRRRGRVHETGMLVALKLKTGHLFQDMTLAWRMFWKGKVPILPSGIRRDARREVKRIFARSENPGKGARGQGGEGAPHLPISHGYPDRTGRR